MGIIKEDILGSIDGTKEVKESLWKSVCKAMNKKMWALKKTSITNVDT